MRGRVRVFRLSGWIWHDGRCKGVKCRRWRRKQEKESEKEAVYEMGKQRTQRQRYKGKLLTIVRVY